MDFHLKATCLAISLSFTPSSWVGVSAVDISSPLYFTQVKHNWHIDFVITQHVNVSPVRARDENGH